MKMQRKRNDSAKAVSGKAGRKPVLEGITRRDLGAGVAGMHPAAQAVLYCRYCMHCVILFCILCYTVFCIGVFVVFTYKIFSIVFLLLFYILYGLNCVVLAVLWFVLYCTGVLYNIFYCTAPQPAQLLCLPMPPPSRLPHPTLLRSQHLQGIGWCPAAPTAALDPHNDTVTMQPLNICL